MGKSNMLKERSPQACLTKGSYAGFHTRWHGLESNLSPTFQVCPYTWTVLSSGNVLK